MISEDIINSLKLLKNDYEQYSHSRRLLLTSLESANKLLKKQTGVSYEIEMSSYGYIKESLEKLLGKIIVENAEKI